MELRTKFNVGDTIHTIHNTHMGLLWEMGISGIIRSIYTSTENQTRVLYVFENEYLYLTKAPEQDCFATEQEAQAECDRRNNGK